jgi:hypothetical protein
MSSPPPLGQYFYYPVFRRGAAADIPASSADPLHGDLPAARVSPNIALEITASGPQGTKNLTGSPVDQNGNTDLFLYGPGDVLAFDTRHIVRTEPANSTPNFESNYFAGIEFDDPDIPWLFTPAQAGTPASGVAQGGLRPWLVLIVLTSADGYTVTKASSPQALDWIHLSNNPQVLPDLADSWAWVHTQLTGALGSDTLPSLVTNNPQRFVARLLCPRALQPDTAYTAFLVPAFLAGAQAALPANLPTPSTATDALGPAWNIGDASVNLPVYSSFSFSTGDAGDFMSLAKRLTPQVLTGVGSRPMAVDDARNQSAWNVPAATSGGATLDLHGALDTLTAPGSSPPPDEWSSSDQATFKPALAAVLNVATPVTGNAADPDPVVVPPIYGRYHAAVTSVSATASGWVNELNLDPRVRAAAGLGAEIVTMERAGLMASAWQQIAGIELVNRILRQAQMTRAALQQIYQATLTTVSSVTLLTVASGVLRRTGIASGTGTSGAANFTAWSAIASSPIPWRALFPAFSRLVSPLGPLRIAQSQTGTSADALINGLNSGTVILTPPNGPGSGTATYPPASGSSGGTGTSGGTSSGGGPLEGLLGPVPAWLQPFAFLLAVVVILLAVVIDIVLLLAGAVGGWLVTAIVLAVLILIVTILIAWWLVGSTAGGTTGTGGTTSTTSSGPNGAGYNTPQPDPGGALILKAATGAPGLSGFSFSSVGTTPSTSSVAGGSDSTNASSFRGVLNGLAGTLSSFGATPTAPSSIDLGALASSVLTALNPASTVVRRALSFVNVDSRLQWNPADPIEPIMAAPDFPQPMYAPLAALSQEYLLPGVGQIPRESVGLLQPNMAFIEAYMVGLNFEIGRQLLWNGYPTDQRGSYFRQFWNVSGYVPGPLNPPLSPADLKDITPIHTWNPASDLGTHPNPLLPTTGLVLIIRGELLRRYPTTHVYAVPAQLTPKGTTFTSSPNPDPSQEVHPVFRGTLDPDLSFFGFPLSPSQAHSAPGQAGYYFVLQQHPTQPRFGLESDGSTDSWQCFPSGFATVAAQSASPALDPSWGRDAATMAQLTFRQPVRVAIHADLMLPGVSS